jgi:hypothetical protein
MRRDDHPLHHTGHKRCARPRNPSTIRALAGCRFLVDVGTTANCLPTGRWRSNESSDRRIGPGEVEKGPRPPLGGCDRLGNWLEKRVRDSLDRCRDNSDGGCGSGRQDSDECFHHDSFCWALRNGSMGGDNGIEKTTHRLTSQRQTIRMPAWTNGRGSRGKGTRPKAPGLAGHPGPG